jgi:hypothetical protein
LRQDAGNVARADNLAFEKFSQIVFLGLLIQSEGQVLRIHLANVEVGDIPHRANRKREIEFHSIRLRRLLRRRFKSSQPIAPTGSVIVVCGEPLLAGLKYQCDHLSGLCGWLHSLDPPQ